MKLPRRGTGHLGLPQSHDKAMLRKLIIDAVRARKDGQGKA